MRKYTWTAVAISIALAVALFRTGMSDEPGGVLVKEPGTVQNPTPSAVEPATVEEARRQAEILHAAIHSTLQVVHHRYYREDEGLPIPAAILKEVFADLENDQDVKLRWLAVEGQPMNSDHQPQTEFEHEAVKTLKSGKSAYERADQGIYRRAGSITLTNHCLKCHASDRKNTNNRVAGLIITLPVKAN